MRYLYKDILVTEIPDELTLGLSITGCSVKCPECHSKELWNKNSGDELTDETLLGLLSSQRGISCVLFLGGEWYELELIHYLKMIKKYALKTALYSGQNLEYFSDKYNLLNELDYLKVGPYISECGTLKNKNTNQRLYTLKNGQIKKDITSLFWR